MNKLLLGTVVFTSVSFAQVNIASCKSCHGADFEKAALGKSKIVKDMTKSEVSAALIGYKNGTYGDSMKGIMRSNVIMYTNKELSTTGIGSSKKIHKKGLISSINLSSCKSCHGVDFEKAALGKSKIVKNMTKSEVSAALIGYKNGTYGDSMKGIMYSNVIMYTNKELSTTGIGINDNEKVNLKSNTIDIASCKNCHGVDFEKAGLGQSKIVAEMTKEEISKALVGYKNGTYGGSMKGIMKTNIDMYTEDELRNTGLGK